MPLQKSLFVLGTVQAFSELEFVCTPTSRMVLINPIPVDRIFGSIGYGLKNPAPRDRIGQYEPAVLHPKSIPVEMNGLCICKSQSFSDNDERMSNIIF